ncbi:hypothetical protein, partial [Corynebacterium macclintockiae]|uniref:hypothetical protein n=1 Tax=Corynebacterium macclintockiae TaxID=2913501 RepID=UPI003EBB2E0F
KPTDPKNADTDGDGVNDGDEVNNKDKDGKDAPTNPNDPNSKPGEGDQQPPLTGSLDDPNKIAAIVGGTIVGSGVLGALLGNHGDAGSSAPGAKPGEAGKGAEKPGKPGKGESKPGKPGAEKPGKSNAGDQGGNQGAGKGNAGNQGGADNGAAGDQGAASQSTEAGSRGGSLAVTGVSGLAITLGASVIALALGGALMALRRRQS